MPETLEDYSVVRPSGTTGKKPRTLAQRIEDFWGYVKKDPNHPLGCWEWTAGVLKSGGYPQFNINGRMRRGHRVSWIIKNGPIPDGIEICHKCDNPKCVNPDHLFPGSHLDNMRDMISKGRAIHPNGENAGGAKFTNDQISEMRCLFNMGAASKATLARIYNSYRGMIGLIVNGTTYPGIAPADKTSLNIKEILERIEKGEFETGPRNQFGERHSQSRLTEEAVRYIRENYRRGEAKPLAEKYGVSISCIRDIAARRRWQHVT